MHWRTVRGSAPRLAWRVRWRLVQGHEEVPSSLGPGTFSVSWAPYPLIARPRIVDRPCTTRLRMTVDWVIPVDAPKELSNADTPQGDCRQGLSRPCRLFQCTRPKVIDLSRSFCLPQSRLLQLASRRGAPASRKWLKETDLLLAQVFTPTTFARVGMLSTESRVSALSRSMA